MATRTKKSSSDKDEAVGNLNKLWVPIPALRTELAKLSKEGYDYYPIGDLLLIVQRLMKENQNGLGD